ncbi:GNAT family N-acetyltransferase [Cardinium endosymbiont of Culicoides punctatus]|uniref:GNAT family N-acetyltransferase n=1 Tax=Cardinium endosymbiont of Culicoides punctatus TaxID=2304601 RepID=UPI001058DD8D|nr:GNAT family N-acetyltransferase [Cardinium endosymbiont of Culicoides punctatus]TDG95595.1 hypothetical protein CCPUN_02130 [Cardinium endosymbiont of Culicoides punctatus]
MHIEYTPNPSTEDVNFLNDQLNKEATGFKYVAPFGFFLRDKNNKIRAGLDGFFMYGAIYTDQLWVAPDCRKLGLGRQLMERVHQLGRENKCKIATVSTMTFLGAQKFYEKLGYIIDFIRPGYANGSSCIFLSKIL